MEQHDDASLVLGRLATGLAAGSGLRAGLELLVADLGLRSAVLRAADAAPGARGLLAVAGDVVSAVPASRAAVPLQPGPEVELAVPGPGGRTDAVLVVAGARPSLLPLLRAAASVLGLALAAGTGDRTGAEVAALVAESDRDGDLLADALHDGPVQALVAARWACDAVRRGGDPAVAREAVQTALVGMRHAMWHLRPRGADDLGTALSALSARLVEAGGAPLHLVVDAAAGPLAGPAAALAYRLVQAVARDADGPVRVGLRNRGGDVVLDVDGGRTLPDPDRWHRRLRALGGDLSSSAGRLRLSLPVPVRLPAAPSAVPAAHPAATPLLGHPGSDTKACS